MGRKGREAGRALAIQELNASACSNVSEQVEPQRTLTAAAVTVFQQKDCLRPLDRELEAEYKDG